MTGLVNKWILFLSDGDGARAEGLITEQIDAGHILVRVSDESLPYSVVLAIADIPNTPEHSCRIFDSEDGLKRYVAWLMAEPDTPKLVPFRRDHH